MAKLTKTKPRSPEYNKKGGNIKMTFNTTESDFVKNSFPATWPRRLLARSAGNGAIADSFCRPSANRTG